MTDPKPPIPPCPECGAAMLDASTSDVEERSYLCLGETSHRISYARTVADALPEFPLITCIMPTMTSRRDFQWRAIEMFEAQSWPNKAMVILEDGPLVAGLPGWLGKLCDSIRYEWFPGSLGAKLNRGAQLAKGSILANWDDDDWYHPDRLSLQMGQMTLSAKPVVSCNSAIFYSPGADVAMEYTASTPWYGLGAAHFYTREWVLAHPHEDISLAEDTHFMQAAHRANDLSLISGMDILVAHNHEGNSSGRKDYTDPEERKWLLRTDNWREVPLERIAAIVGPINQLTGA